MSIRISQLSASVYVTGSDLLATVIDKSGSLITTKATVQQVFNYITSSVTDLTLNNLTVLDSTILGENSSDSLTINATTVLNSALTASDILATGNLEVISNTVLSSVTASALNVVGSTYLLDISGTVAQFTDITGTNLISINLTSSDGKFDTLSGSNVLITSLTSSDGKFDTLSGSNVLITNLTSSDGKFDILSASNALVNNLTSSDGKFDILSASNALVNNLTGTEAVFTKITASFNGDGSNLTNIPNGALQNSSITIGTTTISLGGSSTIIDGLTQLTASSAYFSGDVFINGTASIVQLNTVNEQSLVVGDKYITILSGSPDHTSLDGSGILWGSGSTDLTTDDRGAAAHVRYDGGYDKLRIFPGLYVSGALTASAAISGTNAYLNNITVINITGTSAQFTSLTGSLVGNISGNASTVTNGVYTVGDQSISGVKTFNSVITASSGITGSFARFTVITGTLSGSITGNANTVTNGVYTIGDQTIAGVKTFNNTITASSGITGSIAKFTAVTSSFNGNGRNITNLTASNITNFTDDVRSQFSAGPNIIIINGVISSTGGGGGGSGSLSSAVTTVTSSLTLDAGYHTVYADASSGNITITLPSASIYNNVEYTIKKIDTSPTTIVTVSSSGGDLIDGYTHIPLDYRFEGITVQSDGTSSWFINSDVSAEVTLVAQGYTNPVGSNNLYVLTGTAAGGVDKTIQFSDAGVLTGSQQFTYDYNTGILSGTVAKFTEITASSLAVSTLTGTVAYFVEITASSISTRLNNLTTNVLLISSDTLLASDNHIILASASAMTDLNITLPSSSVSQYRQYVIKKVDSNSSKIIISGSGGETIDGIDGTQINTQYETLTLVSNGISEWFII